MLKLLFQVYLLFCVVMIGLCGCKSETKEKRKDISGPKAIAVSWKYSEKKGALIYKRYCLACHQADGKGVSRIFPPLHRNKRVEGEVVNLVKVVVEGLQGPVEVAGENYNNIMPGHPFLSNAQLADLLTYIRTNFGNKGDTVTLQQVAALR